MQTASCAAAGVLRERRERRLHRVVSSCAVAGSAVLDDTCDTTLQAGRLSHDCDVVIIGAGVSGLCAAAVLSSQGVRCTVVEAHSIAGGAAHSFERGEFKFDSGPSFYFGLSGPRGTSANALRQALDLLDEAVPCVPYTSWRVHTRDGAFDCTTNEEEYCRTIRRFAGADGEAQWRRLQARLKPLSAFSAVLPFAALRNDPAVLLSLSRFAPGLLSGMAGLASSPAGLLGSITALNGSFGDVIASAGVTHPWLLALLDLESFVISGCLARNTPAPEMAFVLDGRFSGAPLDHPVGGGQAWVDALVRGISRRGGRVELRAPVARIVVTNGRAAGVELGGGRGVVTACTAVIASTSVWDTAKLLPPGAAERFTALATTTPECESFMHLHVGFSTDGMDIASVGIHHLVVENFAVGAIQGARNVINISIPSALDDTLAPPGFAVAHVYAAANENFDDWGRLARGSAAYDALKEERCRPLWAALERVIPDIRARARTQLVGSPLTHARYLRRHRGSYGPALAPGAWPGPATELPGLWRCGDSTFPGIGIPAAAASGLIVANTLLSPQQHGAVLDLITRRG